MLWPLVCLFLPSGSVFILLAVAPLWSLFVAVYVSDYGRVCMCNATAVPTCLRPGIFTHFLEGSPTITLPIGASRQSNRIIKCRLELEVVRQQKHKKTIRTPSSKACLFGCFVSLTPHIRM